MFKGICEAAAGNGHIDVLEFALRRGYTLGDPVFATAVINEQFATVEFLIKHGLPRKPFIHLKNPLTPGILHCYQLMFDKKISFNPGSLTYAAHRGQLDFVRCLHKHGLPLWQSAFDFPACLCFGPNGVERLFSINPEVPRDLYIPSDRKQVERMWKALRYGSVYGAPVLPEVEELFRCGGPMLLLSLSLSPSLSLSLSLSLSPTHPHPFSPPCATG